AELWAAIDRVLVSGGVVSGEWSGAAPVTTHHSPLTTHHSPLTPLLDPPVLLAACGGDDAVLGRICRAFQAGLPGHLTAVRDALRGRDAPRLREAAHKLCGMVAAFSNLAAAVASHLEDLAADGRLEECGPLVEQLETTAQELLRQVNGLSIEDLRNR